MGLLRGQSAHPRRTPSPQEPREASARRRRTTVNTAGSESQGHDRERKRDECKAQTDSLLKHAKAQVRPQGMRAQSSARLMGGGHYVFLKSI